jgi:hypothetical protein
VASATRTSIRNSETVRGAMWAKNSDVPRSEAAWAHGRTEYSGIQAQLEDAAADTPQMVESHPGDVKPYPRGLGELEKSQ